MDKRRTILMSLILAIVGSGLLVTSRLLTLPAGDITISPDLSPRPSPTWASLPHRSTPAGQGSEAAYQLFYQALLRGETAQAEQLLETLQQIAPEGNSELYIAGARLALAKDSSKLATDLAWDAIKQDPENPLAWSLLGVILISDGNAKPGGQALAIAQSMDPSLALDALPTRWQAAIACRDVTAAVALAADFEARYPGNTYAPYYHAEALLIAGDPSAAITLLVGALAEKPEAPALLWYTLGRAYLARASYSEAATSLEAAAYRMSRGDTSLELISARPLDDLNEHLGEAYLQTARCAEAEIIFRRLEVTQPDLDDRLEAAVVCQTPTPTLTPWIPVQIGTVTPRP